MQYSETQLDALRELANIGSGTAATALSRLLSRPIDVSVPAATAQPLADALDAGGDAGTAATGVLLPIAGDVDGIVLLLFAPRHAAALCSMLGVAPGSDLAVSALAEIGHILGSSYVGALAKMPRPSLERCPPQTATDLLGAIVSSVLATGAAASDLAL